MRQHGLAWPVGPCLLDAMLRPLTSQPEPTRHKGLMVTTTRRLCSKKSPLLQLCLGVFGPDILLFFFNSQGSMFFFFKVPKVKPLGCYGTWVKAPGVILSVFLDIPLKWRPWLPAAWSLSWQQRNHDPIYRARHRTRSSQNFTVSLERSGLILFAVALYHLHRPDRWDGRMDCCSSKKFPIQVKLLQCTVDDETFFYIAELLLQQESVNWVINKCCTKISNHHHKQQQQQQQRLIW